MKEILQIAVVTPLVLVIVYMAAVCMSGIVDELSRFLVKLAARIGKEKQ